MERAERSDVSCKVRRGSLATQRMKNMIRKLVLIHTLVLAAPGVSFAASSHGAASSTKVEEARERYQRGLKLYDDGNYDAARVEFERAYSFAPTYKILYNIGLSYKQLNNYVDALSALERYLAEGGREIPDDRRKEVEREVGDLKQRVSTVSVGVNIAGADISVDDVVVAKSPADRAIVVNPGRRRISASKSGWFTASKTITVGGSERASVDLVLVAPPKSEKVDLLPIVSWGITGAVAVGTGITGFLALKAKSDQEEQLGSPSATRTGLDDADSKRKTMATVSDVLLVTTIVGVGVSSYLTWFRKKKESANETSLGVSPLGVSLSGRY